MLIHIGSKARGRFWFTRINLGMIWLLLMSSSSTYATRPLISIFQPLGLLSGSQALPQHGIPSLWYTLPYNLYLAQCYSSSQLQLKCHFLQIPIWINTPIIKSVIVSVLSVRMPLVVSNSKTNSNVLLVSLKPERFWAWRRTLSTMCTFV